MTDPKSRISSYRHAGLTFDVVDGGPLDGEPIVLLHGFPQRATSWEAVSARLHEAGYRTFAPDQRGYSTGARPPRRRDYTTVDLAADTAALIDEIGGSAHVVGHDWGAAVAWAVASAYPDKVRTLTAVSVPHPAALMRAWRTRKQLRKSWYIVTFQLPYFPERTFSREGEQLMRRAGMPAPAIARLRPEMIDSGALRYALNWYRAMVFSSPKSVGHRISRPTTYVWSSRDVALGREAAELCAQYVTGPYEYVVMDGVSHWILDEAPDRLADVILTRVGSE